MKRSPQLKRKTHLRQVGRRAKRVRGELDDFRRNLRMRSKRLCERCDCPTHPDSLEAHHLVPRSRGAGWPQLHDASLNGLRVCFYCHRALDLYPRDFGGPAEAVASRAFAAFERWRAGHK